ncbi:MAG: hypothetical protein RL358_692 [Pseudomonadota bacterium]|jgi:type IV pilus assembly protein PilO
MIDFEELKNLNPEDPGSWPWAAKVLSFLVVFVTVVAVGVLFFSKDKWSDLRLVEVEEETLKISFLDKKKQAINLDLIKKQLNETQESLGALLKQLPNKSEMDALLTDINQAGLGRGLQFDLFKPGVESTIDGSFVEQPISLKVNGNYDDLGRFASDISMLPRIVTLNEISIAPTSGSLFMEATAKTYRYLDENEVAAQKKASKTAGVK